MNGRLTALNQVISRSMNKRKPFFHALKKNGTNFCWKEECEIAFEGLKRYLASSPLLFKSTSEEMFFLYPAISVSSMSGALICEDENIQKLVYYISHSMNRAQTRYQRLEKLVLALFIISRTLKYYFQTFPITVLPEHPLRSVIEYPEAMR